MMNKKGKRTAEIAGQTEIAAGVFSMWLKTEAAQIAIPGQFLSLYSKDKSRMLPRPISICDIDQAGKRLRIVYRVVGDGTGEFSGLASGDVIDFIGPLGNGFPVQQKRALLVGGGIGIPPMLALAKSFQNKPVIVAGYQDEVFLTEELEQASQLYIATDSGRVGTKGTVLDAIRKNEIQTDVIYACGPHPMLKGLKEYAREQQIECWVSLEERMACGIGACLACVCKSSITDEHTQVANKRICKEGPVFRSTEVVL